MGAGTFRGHAFHYSQVVLAPGTRFVYTLSRGHGIEGMRDGAVVGNVLGAYCHLHPVAARRMFTAFVDSCRTATAEA
jgi:cobyrinic acid a,c-diamide synthase